MKTLSVNNLHFFDMPEGAYGIALTNPIVGLSFISFAKEDGSLEDYHLPPGSWEAVGFVRELSEEQAANLVQKNQYGHSGWKTYTEKSGLMFGEKSALESFRSLMEANRVYLKNPLGVYPPMLGLNESLREHDQRMKQWHQYQERVLPNAFLLFRK